MLVITRRLNESIMVGDNIRIVILGIDGDRIKIGIEAPPSLKILRAELFAEVRDVNREAIVTDMSSLQKLLCGADDARPAGGAGQDAAVGQPDGQPAGQPVESGPALPGPGSGDHEKNLREFEKKGSSSRRNGRNRL